MEVALRCMDRFVYFLYRALSLILGFLPLRLAIGVGRAVGACAWGLCWPYRRLVKRNLQIAFGDHWTETERSKVGAESFARMAGNVAASMHLAGLPVSKILRFVECEGLEHVRHQLAQQRGMVMVISHMGNWELLSRVFPAVLGCRCGTIFQKLSNPWMDAAVRRERAKEGLLLFERKEGFNGALSLLRQGGAVGVLADQHAGDPGLWCSFFGKLASTSPLPATMAARTGAVLLTCGMDTLPNGRWRLVIGAPFNGPNLGVEEITIAANAAIEAQIRRSPPDWLWAHNRWKTPFPNFLLSNSRRGCSAKGLSKPFKIVVRSPNWLGDAVMTVPAIRSIRRGRPDLELTVLAPAKLAEFWKAVEGVDQVLAIGAGELILSVAGRLRVLGFDAAVVFPNSLRTGLEVWFAGIPRRVGFPGHLRKSLLNQVCRPPVGGSLKLGDPPSQVPDKEHQIYYYLRLARYIGGQHLEEHEWFCEREGADRRRIEGRSAKDFRWKLAVCPGAEFGAAKRWLPERFAEVMQAIAVRQPCEWHIIGVQKDLPIGARVEEVLSNSPLSDPERGAVRLHNWMGKTSLGELISLLKGCDALLTNDTGTMHLAVMLGVPVVAVFGSTEPRATGPVGRMHRVLQHAVPCGPCFLRDCPRDFACMEKVSVQEVVCALEETLDSLFCSKKVLPGSGSDLMLSSP